MEENQASAPIQLTSVSTTYFARVVPPMVTLVTGGTAAAAWLGLMEDVDSFAKLSLLGVAVVASFLSYWWLGRFKHVWLDGEYLVIGGGARRGVRVALRDVADVEETRLHKMKWAKVTLTRSTPLGDTIRFIPRGREAWLTPWVSSPVVKDLRRRVERAKGLGPGGPAGSPPETGGGA